MSAAQGRVLVINYRLMVTDLVDVFHQLGFCTRTLEPNSLPCLFTAELA